MKLYEKTLSSQSIFDGRIIHVHVDEVELENGKTAMREVVDHPGGVSVAVLTEKNELFFVRQFRYPFGEVTEELPAGKMDRGETHEAAARRELSEEVGCEAGELLYLGELLVSPGYSTEAIHMYLARELTHGAQHLDEDEFLEPVRPRFSACLSG